MNPAAGNLQVYRHSGQLGRGAWLLPVGGMLVALVLGVIYGLITVYNPLIGYVSLFVSGGFGWLLGLCVSKLAIWGQCRNTRFVNLMAGLTGLAGLYTAWASFVYFIINRNSTQPITPPLTYWLFDPAAIFNFMDMLTVNGYFTIKSSTPSGIMLWIFWVLEAGIILFLVFSVAADKVKETVYCEACQCWAKLNKGFAHLGDIRSPAWTERVQNGELQAIVEAPPYERSAAVFLRLDNQVCERCKTTETTSINRVTLTTDDKGNTTENVAPVTDVLLLDDNAKLTLAQTLAKRQADEEARKAANIEAAKKKEAERKAAIEAKKAPPPENEPKA